MKTNIAGTTNAKSTDKHPVQSELTVAVQIGRTIADALTYHLDARNREEQTSGTIRQATTAGEPRAVQADRSEPIDSGRPSEPTIPELIQVMNCILHESHDLLGQLSSVLTPILQPEGPGANASNGLGGEEIRSPIAESIICHTRGLHSLNLRIMSLVERAALPK